MKSGGIRMAEQQPKENEKPSNKEPALVVKIKPGSSSEKSIKAILPDSLNSLSVDKVIDYVLDNSTSSRKDERIAERIKAERTGSYGITANGEPVSGTEGITSYFVDKTSPQGTAYRELELIIAAKQEGGLHRYLR